MSATASGNSNNGSSPTNNIAPTSSLKPNRLPAPTLFVGPPSRNASQLSFTRDVANDASSSRPPTRDPLTRTKSALTRPFNPSNPSGTFNDHPPSNLPNNASPTKPNFSKPSEAALERRWKEMQSTLNDVELTAQSSNHVFSETHAQALDNLRKAQVDLALAWGRGHEERTTVGPAAENASADGSIAAIPAENISKFNAADELASARRGAGARSRADTDASASTALSDDSSRSEVPTLGSGSRSGGGGGGSGGGLARTRLEDETAQDIKLAGERRAANEAYFKKVDNSVKDVVERLKTVAEMMKGVEAESRSLWSEEGSLATRHEVNG